MVVGLLSISPREAAFDVRGFHDGRPQARKSLERHGVSFVSGYNAALDAGELEALVMRLERVPDAERGFAYEGAAMALALLDLLSPRRRDRLAALLKGPGQPHVYMIHVGAGWALARLRLRPRLHLPALDPFLRWLTVDGYGFQEAFFHTRRTVVRKDLPRRLHDYERRAFDQGVGRALWFVDGGDVDRAARTVQSFGSARGPDLWSGLALAVAYTTAARRDDLGRLRRLGARQASAVAQGAAFAVAARHRAGNVLPETETAAQVLCGTSVDNVVEVVHTARMGLVADSGGRGYERWRMLVGRRLLEHLGSVAA